MDGMTTMRKRNTQGLDLGPVGQGYINDLAKYGKAGMRKRLREASNRMIERQLLRAAVRQDKLGSWIPR